MGEKKVVIFAGAGYSWDAGYPVTSNFDKVTHVADYHHGFRQQKRIPYRAYQGLQAAWHHAHKSVPTTPQNNCESVFNLLDFHSTIHPYWKIAYYKQKSDNGNIFRHVRAEDGLKIECVRKQFIRALAYVYCEPYEELLKPTNGEPERGGQRLYEEFLGKLAEHKLAIVTTNYDLVTERALGENRYKQVYCWNEFRARECGKALICKIHGSVNWIKKAKEEPVRFNLISRDQLKEKYENGYEPLIIPPTWRKTASDGDGFPEIWRAGAYALANADIVYIIGCGLPVTDIHIRYFLSTGLSGAFSGKTNRDVFIINPDLEANDRIQDLICLSNTVKGVHNRICGKYDSIEDAQAKGAFDIT